MTVPWGWPRRSFSAAISRCDGGQRGVRSGQLLNHSQVRLYLDESRNFICRLTIVVLEFDSFHCHLVAAEFVDCEVHW